MLVLQHHTDSQRCSGSTIIYSFQLSHNALKQSRVRTEQLPSSLVTACVHISRRFSVAACTYSFSRHFRLLLSSALAPVFLSMTVLPLVLFCFLLCCLLSFSSSRKAEPATAPPPNITPSFDYSQLTTQLSQPGAYPHLDYLTMLRQEVSESPCWLPPAAKVSTEVSGACFHSSAQLGVSKVDDIYSRKRERTQTERNSCDN